VNATAYERMFRYLGFVGVRRRRKLRHAANPATVYFNSKSDGTVYFATYQKDRGAFRDSLWLEIGAQQKKDKDRRLITLVPVEGKEIHAFQDILKGR
jgi:hypothetical protein